MALLSSFIDFRWFFASFCVGILIVYLTAPKHHIVYRFPSPNHPDMVFSNKDGECYKFDAQKVRCADFGDQVRDQPNTLLLDDV
jgi:hypothetical protein